MIRRNSAKVPTDVVSNQSTKLWRSSKVMVLDNILNNRLGTAQSSSLPDLESIEDSTSDEKKQKHDLDLNSKQN